MKKKLLATILTATMILGTSTTAMAAEFAPSVSANVPYTTELETIELELADDTSEIAMDTPMEGVVVDENSFPDEAFRGLVLYRYDKDKNEILSPEETNNISRIKISNTDVKDLTGIEYFTNLQELVCANNQITELDVNCFKNLTYLDCSKNNIEELRIEGLTKLTKLKCTNNQLEVLELHGLTSLWQVFAEDNYIETLNMSNLPSLLRLQIPNNRLESVDLSAAPSLVDLIVSDNKLKTLDVSMLPKLYLASCDNNALVCLDVSNNPEAHPYTFFKQTVDIGGRQYDLSQYDPSFDVSRVSNLQNLSFKGSTVSISEGFESGSYSYDCGRGFTMTITINVGAKNGFFDDVPVIEGNWKYDNIKYVYDRGIMNGISGTNLFDPDGKLNRAMFATVLYRMAGEPDAILYLSQWKDIFSDVSKWKYYSLAVAWAYDKGIVNGFSDGTFGVERSITREQIAKMLYLYGEYEGYDVSGKASLDGFTDSDEVSGWAVPYMEWAVDAGMISGKPNGDGTFRLDPKGEATRAECAKMLAMFMQKY